MRHAAALVGMASFFRRAQLALSGGMFFAKPQRQNASR